MTTIYQTVLDELAAVFKRIDAAAVDRAVDEIAAARRIALYGVGREGLQMKGFAMRLFHLGLQVGVVGDMTAPRLEAGDLLIVSAGPGNFSTVAALIGVAHAAGARSLIVTAKPEGACPMAADIVLPLPLHIATDAKAPSGSAMSMGGSIYEGAQFVLFEAMVLKLRDKLNVAPATMYANHTNLE